MRVEIINNQTTESVNVEIHCKDITDEVKRLKRHIDNFSTGISGTEDGNTYIVSPNAIFYIEVSPVARPKRKMPVLQSL